MRSLALVVLSALSLAGAAEATPTSPGRIEFEVLRNGAPFGRHVVTVSGSGASFTARTAVTLTAGVGPLMVFRYEQNCTETWSGGALSALNCSTLKEGRRTQVRATAGAQGLSIQGARGSATMPHGVLPTSWWVQPPTTVSSMLNTENGTALPVRITRIGRETIDVGGARVQATHIRVAGTTTVDLWYDDANRWVGCAFTIRGQHITYRLTSAPGAGPA